MASDENRQLDLTQEVLVREFGPALGEQRVREDVAAVVRQYDAAPVRTYLSVLVEREARRRLRGLVSA